MGSLAAREVAREVLATIGRGKKPNISKLAVKHGYSPTTAGAGLVQATKSYKDEIGAHLDKMKRLREKALDAALEKPLDKERYQTLVATTASLTHDIQLLSGGKTENVSIEEDRRVLLAIVSSLRTPHHELTSESSDGTNTHLTKRQE